MVAHAVVAVCLMRAESRFGESDGFDSRWAGVDEVAGLVSGRSDPWMEASEPIAGKETHSTELS